MATSTRTIRAPDATWALLDAEAERRGMSANALAATLLGDALAPRSAQVAPRSADAPRKAAAREAAAAASAKTGVAVTAGVSRARAAMDAAGIEEWDPNAKRVPYQKGSAGAGKAKGRR